MRILDVRAARAGAVVRMTDWSALVAGGVPPLLDLTLVQVRAGAVQRG